MPLNEQWGYFPVSSLQSQGVTQTIAAILLSDLTAAFDRVDQDILLSRLETYVGFKDSPLTCGFPQG